MSSSTHTQISKRCLATTLRVSSTIATGDYVLNKERRGAKATGFRKQCHEGNTTSSSCIFVQQTRLITAVPLLIYIFVGKAGQIIHFLLHYCVQSSYCVVAVVVPTLPHRYNAVRGHRTLDTAPITLERKITSGGKRIRTEDDTHNN